MRAQFQIQAPRATSLILSEAVLIYRDTGARQTRAYASVHQVEVADGRPVVLAGKPLSPRHARRLAAELCRQSPVGAPFLDGRTLYSGPGLLAWWLPAARRHMAFRCEALGERGETLPHPSLVFAVSGKGWWVWALKSDERPGPDTKLYRAPFFNVGDDGAICQGSTVMPTGDACQRIDAWTDAFFGSFFSHPSGTKIVRHPGGAHAFWKSLLDSAPARFPARVLVPANATLADTVSSIGGYHE